MPWRRSSQSTHLFWSEDQMLPGRVIGETACHFVVEEPWSALPFLIKKELVSEREWLVWQERKKGKEAPLWFNQKGKLQDFQNFEAVGLPKDMGDFAAVSGWITEANGRKKFDPMRFDRTGKMKSSARVGD